MLYTRPVIHQSTQLTLPDKYSTFVSPTTLNDVRATDRYWGGEGGKGKGTPLSHLQVVVAYPSPALMSLCPGPPGDLCEWC